MVVMSVVFGRLGGIAKFTGKTPYPIFVYSGLLPWSFFASALSSSSSSVVGNAALITKIRFPRIALPIAATVREAVDFCLSLVVLLGLMFWYHLPLRPSLLLIPFLTIGVGMIALGIGSVFASINVKYRDVPYLVPFIIQIWMYLTPVIYPAALVPSKFRWFLLVNPLSGWIGGFRAAVLGNSIPWQPLGISMFVSCVLLLAGIYYFRATERRFAEII
jgi:lipopolysaccharide transport system permease protein